MFSKVKKLSQNNTATMQSKRTHSEVTESTPMTSNASKKQKTGSGPKKLYMMHEFDSTEIAVVVAKNTQQELVPKMVQKGGIFMWTTRSFNGHEHDIVFYFYYIIIINV